ncbi:conserved hypothetical protein [Leishmania infantum JPCM5]|uniref:Uncharacterized protein n=2 Tax=Leishmania infantum TaxID=5671 RepID=A4I9P9_LEIIN|nr:conserved hypothetical protein [Leishmania infantum JPCM5]CAC9537024.1 hypothetical_protein_-_conserved [Leishmania infantum]CAM71552.1 conserved hypothetical protein [Leishmania infantum JPCM5]SUZ45460.1 hypothetical_protein_-_conserved [Leishmania infantum]|eukprot:XP_001468468.1 conserved hypothetical protein [Leishmania infantum JPCM5]
MTSFNSLGGGAGGPAEAVTRLQEVLRDICATERRQEKTWLNVQPCVLNAVKLLAATAQMYAERVRQLEGVLQHLQQYTTVLVQDREVKEERYRLDAAAHREEADELWKRLLRLEAQQQVPSLQIDQRASDAFKASCEAAVEARVAPLQQELQGLRHQLKALALSHPYSSLYNRHVRSSSVASNSSALTVRDDYYAGGDGVAASQRRHHSADSSSSTSSLSSPASSTASSLGRHEQRHRRGRVATTSAPTFTPRALAPATAAASPSTQMMMREVRRLRRQWQQFLQSVPAALAQGKGPCGAGLRRRDISGSPSRRLSRLTSKDGRRDLAGGLNDVTRANGEGVGSINGNPPQPFRVPAHHPPSSPTDAMLPKYSSGPTRAHSGARAAEPSTALPASGRRVRWYWLGDAHSHFSTATRRAENDLAAAKPLSERPQPALSGASPALPWTECHAFDGRTDCWYSLGTWATHRRHLREVERAVEEGASRNSGDVRLGWLKWTSSLVSWPDTSTMLVHRAGIYMVRVCLVRHCASASLCSGAGRAESVGRDCGSGGALALCMNGVAVAGLREVVTHALLYTHSTASPAEAAAPWWATRGRSRSTCASAGNYCSAVDGVAHSPACASPGGSPSRRRFHGDIADATQRQRPCCEPAQLHTNTLTACLFLPAGAMLQVRCRGLHNTKTIHEAFCELEYVV